MRREHRKPLPTAAIALLIELRALLGLPHLSDQRPFLILGPDLIDFRAKRDQPKRRCGVQELFCFRCREPKTAAGGMIDFTPQTTGSGTISALWETC
jgi:hypothetical protein